MQIENVHERGILHVARQTDAYNHSTTYTYDANNNLTSIAYPLAARDQSNHLTSGAIVSWAYADASHPWT